MDPQPLTTESSARGSVATSALTIDTSEDSSQPVSELTPLRKSLNACFAPGLDVHK